MSYSEEELRGAANAFHSGVWVRRRGAHDVLQEAIDELITLRQRAEELEVQNTQLREEIVEYQWQRPALWAAQQRVADYDELVLHLRDMLMDRGHMDTCPRVLGTGNECAEGCVDFRLHFEDAEKELKEYNEKIAVVRDERDDAEAAVQVMSLRKALLEKERDDLQAKLKRRDLKVEEGLRRLNRRQWDGDYPDKQDTRPAEWQEGEAEAHAELASGQGRTFDNGADAVRWLQDKPTYEELQQRITMQVRHIVAVSTACHKVKEQNWHLKRQLAISKAEVKRLNGTLPAYAVERYDPEQRQGHHRRLREQEVKIERLQQKVVVLKKHLAQAGEAYIARVQAMKEALRFYADDSNYGELEPATGELVNIKAWVDGGQRARTALGEEK